MKFYLLIVLVLISKHTMAQDSTNIKIEAPKIVAKLPLGKTYNSEDIQIKFVDVLTDSRCPEDATCFWAGQVVALVEVYKNNTLLTQKELVFEPGKTMSKDLMTLYASEETVILAQNVFPYPRDKKQIKKEDYYLQLGVHLKE
ncbi:hypothetical protein [Xanthomarina sp. GH4-25]|uniref:hypothetical protein n=1 Tax=Xanthomarina sp. GH4-25 TaxID=3349335 RepID=UPI000F4DB350